VVVETPTGGNKDNPDRHKMQFQTAGQLLRSKRHRLNKPQYKKAHRQAALPGERKEIQAVRGAKLPKNLMIVGALLRPANHQAEAGVNNPQAAMPGAASKIKLLTNNNNNNNNSSHRPHHRLHRRRHQHKNQAEMPGR
jgi:hypothetical protein